MYNIDLHLFLPEISFTSGSYLWKKEHIPRFSLRYSYDLYTVKQFTVDNKGMCEQIKKKADLFLIMAESSVSDLIQECTMLLLYLYEYHFNVTVPVKPGPRQQAFSDPIPIEYKVENKAK